MIGYNIDKSNLHVRRWLHCCTLEGRWVRSFGSWKRWNWTWWRPKVVESATELKYAWQISQSNWTVSGKGLCFKYKNCNTWVVIWDHVESLRKGRYSELRDRRSNEKLESYWIMRFFMIYASFQTQATLTRMILVNNQLDKQFFMYVYFYSVHVSGSHVPIIRRIIVSVRRLVYVTLCRWRSGVHTRRSSTQSDIHTRRSPTQSDIHTRRSPTQSDINQASHWYNNSPDDGHMAARNM